MNVVDSSGWLEYFAGGPNADFFAPAITNLASLIVPSTSIYEVYKRVLQQRGDEAALQAVAVMSLGQIVDLGLDLAISAAELSAETRLPMADSIILATARAYEATLWTQDADLNSLDGVEYISR